MQSSALSAVACGSFWVLECHEALPLRRCHSEPTLLALSSSSDDDGKSACGESTIATACGDSDSEGAPGSSRCSVSEARPCLADVAEGAELRSESDFNGSPDHLAPEVFGWPVFCLRAQEVAEPAFPSLGSMGHPFACGAACKYATKRGCKDGAACSHCHLCQWSSKDYAKSRKLRKQEDARVNRYQWSR